MHQETISILRARAYKTTGRVLTVLVFSTAFLRPDLAIGGGFHDGGFHGGFHGGGFHPGFLGFHGGAFQPRFHEFHTGAFQPGFHEFRAAGFHDGHFGEFHRFDHHGFRRGLVVVPALGAWWGVGWGWPDYYYPEWCGSGWGWPDYFYPNGGYYGSEPYASYWYYCADPAGYYPYVTQCNTAWQAVPAS